MDKYKDNGIILAQQKLLKYPSEVKEMANSDKKLLNNVYREISEALGMDSAVAMYHLFTKEECDAKIRALTE